jgi:hypothetical protein
MRIVQSSVSPAHNIALNSVWTEYWPVAPNFLVHTEFDAIAQYRSAITHALHHFSIFSIPIFLFFS